MKKMTSQKRSYSTIALPLRENVLPKMAVLARSGLFLQPRHPDGENPHPSWDYQTMNQYLADSALAARGIFSLIGDDEVVLLAKQHELESAAMRRASAQAILHLGAPTTGFGEVSTPYFEKKVRDARREISQLRDNTAVLEAAILAKETSAQALAAAILQIAKQGIAIVRGNLTACPPGPLIGRELLKNVIWQARNQSMHWEENSYRPAVMKCFANLRLDFGGEYQLPSSSPKCIAKQILHLIGWTDYASYENDIVSLLG